MSRPIQIAGIALLSLAALLALIAWFVFLPMPDSPARPAEGEPHIVERDGRSIEYFVRGRGATDPARGQRRPGSKRFQ